MSNNSVQALGGKNNQFLVRFKPTDAEKIRNEAAALGLKPAVYLRSIALGLLVVNQNPPQQAA